MCTCIHARALALVLTVACCLAVSGAAAQVSGPDNAAPFIGRWSINRELSAATPSPDFMSRRGGGRRGGGPVIGGGFGGGFGGGRSGRAPDDNARGEARAEGERLAALTQELVTPTTSWMIARAQGLTLALTSADGRTARYTPNSKTEKHQLTNGTIETKSKWNGGELWQEIKAADGIEMVRVFAVDPATAQLTVTITFAGGGGQDRPFRVVYDRDQS